MVEEFLNRKASKLRSLISELSEIAKEIKTEVDGLPEVSLQLNKLTDELLGKTEELAVQR